MRTDPGKAIAAERRRIEAEYDRRAQHIVSDLYAPWQPWTRLEVEQRISVAEAMLREAQSFPSPGDACLEVGCGTGGWLGTLLHWGVRPSDLHGVDLSASRLEEAQAKFPGADLYVADGCALPWGGNAFRLVIVSVVFTSILDSVVRKQMAGEIERVLAPDGVLLWYDFAFNNPRNRNVRKVTQQELRQLFPNLRGKIARVTLAPPVARAIARRSWGLAQTLSRVPWLRTHLLAVLRKDGSHRGASS